MPALRKLHGSPSVVSVPNRVSREQLQFITSNDNFKLITDEHPVVRTCLELIRIPSPSIRIGHPKEDEMRRNMADEATLIINKFKELGVPEKKHFISIDEYGSLIIRIPASKGFKDKRALMFVAHMDIVPADLNDPTRPINPRLIIHKTPEGRELYIATDGTTTLGSDDKAGVAVIWEVVRLLTENNIPHGPIEIVISPDEETTNASLYKLDTSKFNAQDVIIVDSFDPFSIAVACSSYASINISIDGLSGGHNGMDASKNIPNAVTVLNDLYSKIGDGVIAYDPDFPHVPLVSKTTHEFRVADTPGGAIPSKGSISITLRGRDKNLEDKEIKRIQVAVRDVESKYRKLDGGIKIRMKVLEREPAWLGSPKIPLVQLLERAARDVGHNEIKSEPEHGFTQGNVLYSRTNRFGKKFVPAAVGVKISEAHSTSEKVSVPSMLEAPPWLCRFVELFVQN